MTEMIDTTSSKWLHYKLSRAVMWKIFYTVCPLLLLKSFQ